MFNLPTADTENVSVAKTPLMSASLEKPLEKNVLAKTVSAPNAAQRSSDSTPEEDTAIADVMIEKKEEKEDEEEDVDVISDDSIEKVNEKTSSQVDWSDSIDCLFVLFHVIVWDIFWEQYL